MSALPWNRVIIYAVLVVVIGYDILCMTFGWPTVSQGVRDFDKELGGLFRWVWLALWLHWFVGLWPRTQT